MIFVLCLCGSLSLFGNQTDEFSVNLSTIYMVANFRNTKQNTCVNKICFVFVCKIIEAKWEHPNHLSILFLEQSTIDIRYLILNWRPKLRS